METYWLKRRGVERFSVFKKLDKTNNEQESMHKVYNFLFKHRQPLPWQFIDEDGEKVDDAEDCEDCEDDRDERAEDLEAETGFLFDRDSEVESEDQSNTNQKDGTDEESVIGVVTGLRIEIGDIEDLFDSDLPLEDSPEGNDDEQQEITAGPWRVSSEELSAENDESTEVVKHLRYYEKKSVIQHNSSTSCQDISSEECPNRRDLESLIPLEILERNEEMTQNSHKKTTSKKQKRKVVVITGDSDDLLIKDLPSKRKRKSVMDGKFRDYAS
ncbi:hypothetical protein QAD02_013886 [Eretmocerus hayati]|uniref:Uncharacterized protein n=1 Tax=Eretmocerus hayati TaxID=131215 RepID=A0ACC2P3D4_9HYME|nr:hypothetical protein QAD02_013886 [Eretmocerus hayati]